jgi:predicted nucleic acid-binding Zn ribbon protein
VQSSNLYHFFLKNRILKWSEQRFRTPQKLLVFSVKETGLKQTTINYFRSCSIAVVISMTEKIPQHMHCQICGKAIPASDTDTMCSDECKQRYQNLTKKRKMWVYIMYALIFVMIAVLFLAPMLGQ